MAWENFLFVRNRKRRCKENFFRRRNLKLQPPNKLSNKFSWPKKIKIQFIDTEKSANTETLHCPRGSVGMCFILPYIRVPSVALTAQMWAGRISCSKAQSGAYKSLCIHKTLSFIHSFIHIFFLKLEFDPAYFLVIGITWSYLFLVWSYKIYITWLFLYEENKRLFFIKQFFFLHKCRFSCY